MKEISIEEFINYKNSDTLVIFGCGPSIKNLSNEDLEILNQYDTMSFNMFCKTGIKTKYYILGEILDTYWRSKNMPDDIIDNEHVTKLLQKTGEDPETYFELLNKNYKNTKLLVWDTPVMLENFDYINKNLSNEYVLFNRQGGNGYRGYNHKKTYNINTLKNRKLLIHRHVGLNACIYIGKCMEYKRIIFCGVDLNNYKYAFDRSIFREKFIEEEEEKPHRSKKYVFEFINYLKNDIDFKVYNKDSALTEIIDTY